MSLVRLLPPFVLVAALVTATPARAGGQQTAALSWARLAGAASCIGTRALAAAVERRLGRPAFVSAAQAELSVEGRIEPAIGSSGFKAVIAVADASGTVLGTREISTSAPRCAALDEDLALVIALMIDPDATLAPAGAPGPAPTATEAPPAGAAPPSAAPLPAVPEAPAPVVIVQRILVPVAPPAIGAPPSAAGVASTPPPSPPKPKRSWRIGIAAGPALALGVLPAVGAAAALRASVEPPALIPIALGAYVWAPSDADAEPLGARFSLVEALLAVCPLAVGDATRLSACAGVRAGALGVGGFGFSLDLSAERPTVGALIEARVARRLFGPLTAWLDLSVMAPLVRDAFFYLDAADEKREVFRMAPITGTVDLLLGLEFR